MTRDQLKATLQEKRVPLVISRKRKLWMVCMGGKPLAFSRDYAWIKTRLAMLQQGVLDVPALAS